jgi:type II secretory pathway pseudopilin PulG
MRYQYPKLLPTGHLPAGFSLIEVILGSLLTIMVVTVAGVGLVNMSRSNLRNSADSELINNLNRASDFISDELRQAQQVETGSGINTTNVPANTIPAGSTIILGIVNPQFPTNRIIYYTNTPRTQDRLLGPRVLYRYGPDLLANGTYNTASWGISSVADLIPNANDTDLTNALKSCDSGWTRTPTNLGDTDGFFVCTNGSTRVNVRLNAKVPLTTGNSDRDRVLYSTDTSVFTRSASSP